MLKTVSNFHLMPTTNEPLELRTLNMTKIEIADMLGH
jgi:hypothetical protein